MRGSDPDAVFYWLSKMVYAGEDPRFIFRRMIIFASEDIGMADPHAVPFVTACAEAFDRVGLPEGHFPLAHAALYCATAPKSNSVLGFFDALKLVEKEREGEVPNHLRDASRDKEGFGHGVGYKYPHEYRQHWVAQQYLPSSLQGRIFYEPGELGYEAQLAAQIRERRELQLAALRENESVLAPPEILSFSPADRTTEQWLARAVDSLSGSLAQIRTELFRTRNLQRHELVLDLTADTGLFTWEAVRKTPEGGVWALVQNAEAERILLEQADNLPDLRRPQMLVGTAEQLPELLADLPDLRFDFIIGRNLLGPAEDRAALLRLLTGLLAPNGTLALAENLPRHGQRLSRFADAPLSPEIAIAEEKIYTNPDDPLVNWDVPDLCRHLQEAGLAASNPTILDLKRAQVLPAATLNRWLDTSQPHSYAARLLSAGLSQEHLAQLAAALRPLANRTVVFASRTAILAGTHIA